MTPIDKDIMEKAIDIFSRIGEGRVDEKAIADALQSARDEERERCAKIALSAAADNVVEDGDGAPWICMTIATAIRKGE